MSYGPFPDDKGDEERRSGEKRNKIRFDGHSGGGDIGYKYEADSF